ncbi:MAG: transcriptional repressor [Acidobacteria bacterium]|nr:MAG: transcriptional repressor [Acidobacteriota bacterium]
MGRLAGKNLGLTRQREVVLRVIRQADRHLTANEVYDEAKRILPTISFATVYNSLRFLKDAGYIAEIRFGNGASRFDKKIDRHDHALCVKCGKLIDIELDFPDDFIQMASRLSGFRLESFEFTLHGVCPECNE